MTLTGTIAPGPAMTPSSRPGHEGPPSEADFSASGTEDTPDQEAGG
ncbi:MAG: hypothetical protein AVDCRST_MAG78-1233 [uncultured Rubrobacteraceae bacterium]|uniref:Uncharacterized protein n=1 Tax=uncultured Rubrobacteraceae bacterium TaxID=349277 RepID=A0A6J4PZZ7_9ACTN|nr:MAG: hypothetical protein AVDCRST_MAG78-1233 [uncultured Rubrobacteraceae bacterium]